MKNKLFVLFLAFFAPMLVYGQRGLFVPNGNNGTMAAANEKRIALVIGNRDYRGGGWQPLRNPINDAQAMRKTLEDVGFEVIVLENASKSQMWNAVLELCRKVSGTQTVALVFYAGHGVEADNENYWVAVDDRSTCRDEIGINNLSIKSVNNKLRNSGIAFNIIVSDACRNNSLPFTCVGTGRDGGRSGFIEYKAEGSFIAFSTSPGTTAADGTSYSNSPYTAALVNALKMEGLTIESVFKQVNRAMQTQGQTPWMHNAFNGDFYFKPQRATPPPVVNNEDKLRDSDGDGIIDSKDRCPHEYGEIENGGCPRKATPSVAVEPPRPAPATPKVGKADFTETATGVSFTMKYVEGNSFQMGSTDYDDEKPVHTVRLSDFYMSKYEVTFSEYDKFCEATGRKKPSDNGWGRGSRPVINVSWEDATAYCVWLSSTTGKTYRLPTEAEWEYAARGGQSYKYAGSDDLDAVAWHSGNSGSQTHPVGQKQANGLGLYDMTGNVWEWCSDWYGSYSSGAVSNPTGAATGSVRVIRGGCWIHDAAHCRPANRFTDAPAGCYNDLGFRLVLLFQ